MKKSEKILATKSSGITIGFILILLGIYNGLGMGINEAIYTLIAVDFIILILLTFVLEKLK